MVVTLPGEVILGQPFNVLHVTLSFALVKSGALMIQVHQKAVLVAQLIHDVLVLIVLGVVLFDQDGPQLVQGLLLEDLHYVLWFDLLGTLGLNLVLNEGEGFKCTGGCICWESFDIVALIRGHEKLVVDA